MTNPEKKDEGGEDLDVFEEWEAEDEEEAEDEDLGDEEDEGAFGPGEGPEDESAGEDLLDLPEPIEEQPAKAKEQRPAAPQPPKAKGPASAKPSAAPKRPAAPKVPAAARPAAPKKFDAAAVDLAPDVPVQVIAVMGKRGMTIKELMELRMGQVIDLKRPPNETIDVVVNGKLFARGELVEIDGRLGVRILKLAK